MTIEQLERLTPGDWFYDVRDQLKWHVYRRAEELFHKGDARRDTLRTVEAIRSRQMELREFFIEAIGGLPESRGDVMARVTGRIKQAGFTIEKLIYESRSRHYVTSLLYLPEDVRRPAPAVLFLCGHAVQGKAYPEYQRVCQLLALNGFVVLAQDPIGQGERLSYWEPEASRPVIEACTRDHDQAGAQCLPLGWSLARFFLHDAMRSLDYLCSRPEVDATRIGLTGNSGGGTQSCLIMMTDPRIAAAAPGTFIMNRRTYMYTGGAQDAEQIWPGFTAAGYDHEDVLLAMAPKPVCVLAVTDDFFPIEGTRQTVQRCRPIWEAFGVTDMPVLVEDRSDHAYTPRLAVEAVRFFARCLASREVEPDYERTSPLPPEELRCTSSGQVRGELPEAQFVFDECVVRHAELAAERTARTDEEFRSRTLTYLKEAVLRYRKPCALNPRTYWSGSYLDLDVSARIWWSQADLLGHGLVFRAPGTRLEGGPWTIAIWEGGTSTLRPHMPWIRGQAQLGRTVLVLDVSGTGALAPHSLNAAYPPLEFYGVIHKLTDDLIWMNDSLAALRVYDVLRCVEMVREYDRATEVCLFGDGHSGRECIYALLVAVLDEHIDGIQWCGPLPTWADWVAERYYDSHNIKSVVLPGVLEHFDTPELVSRGLVSWHDQLDSSQTCQ